MALGSTVMFSYYIYHVFWAYSPTHTTSLSLFGSSSSQILSLVILGRLLPRPCASEILCSDIKPRDPKEKMLSLETCGWLDLFYVIIASPIHLSTNAITLFFFYDGQKIPLCVHNAFSWSLSALVGSWVGFLSYRGHCSIRHWWANSSGIRGDRLDE